MVAFTWPISEPTGQSCVWNKETKTRKAPEWRRVLDMGYGASM